MKVNQIIAILLMLWMGLACSEPYHDQPLPENNVVPLPSLKKQAESNLGHFDQWQKRMWLQKTSRLLRAGRELNEQELQEFAQLPYLEVVERFIDDPFFADTVLDYSAHFVGFKMDSIYIEPTDEFSFGSVYNFFIPGLPQAISGARAMLGEGQFADFLDFEQPIYMSKLTSFVDSTPKPGEEELPPEEIQKLRRAEVYQTVYDDLAVGMAKIANPQEGFFADFCEWSQAHSQTAINEYLSLGIPFDLGVTLITSSHTVEMLSFCGTESEETAEAHLGKLREVLVDLELVYRRFSDELEVWFADDFEVHSTIDFKIFDFSKIGDFQASNFASFTTLNVLQNSSTNFSRKRAAYILDRYFCDNLAPINVEDVSEHVGSRHGQQQSCFACHYRLDPMAGFFRNRGVVFTDFTNFPFMVFDDNAIMDKSEYHAAWKSTSSQRQWDVGYIRSTVDESQNTYGSNLNDLFYIIKTAPEVKSCMVKRMFEYAVAEEQAVDDQFMASLSHELETLWQQDSNKAIKNLFKRVVLSNSFSKVDKEASECYDFVDSDSQVNRPPCAINFLLQSNCVNCHSSNGASGGLNLTVWRDYNGQFNFEHKVRGQQMPAVYTLSLMAQRLNETDKSLRMPLFQHMDPTAREKLYLWLQQKLGEVN